MSDAEDNVHTLNIPPKTHTEQYKRKTITVTFLPAEKLWRWSFGITIQREINGTATTIPRALAEARKRIDNQ
jgi:hypothetical protein